MGDKQDEEAEFQYLEIDESRETTSSTGAKNEKAEAGAIWCYGAAAFVIGFFIDAIYNLWGGDVGFNKGSDPHGIFKVIYAVMQTAGLIVMALMDVDINDYLRDRPHRILCFSVAWVLSFVLWACSPSLNVRIGALIVALPFVYTAVRFKQVAKMRAGFTPFSEILMFGLVLFTVFLNAMVYLTNTPADLEGLSYLAGAALMAGVYYWTRQKYQSLTDTLNTGILVFLLQYGFNWLFWDCFVADHYQQKQVSIGFWLFGFIHFASAVMVLCIRHESHYKLPLGLMLFVSGIGGYGLVLYYDYKGSLQTAGWAYLLIALLQTGGLLMITLEDVNMNVYAKGHKVQAGCIVCMWVAGIAVQSLYSKDGAVYIGNQVNWLQCLPWLYFAIRFRQVSNMREGFPLFTELIALALAFQFVGNGVPYFYQTEIWKNSIVVWPWILMGCHNFLSAGIVLAVAFHFSPRRSKHSATVQLRMTLFTYLFAVGIGQAADNVLMEQIFHYTSKNNPGLTIPGWTFVPVHIVPTALMICFRRMIYRRIGKKWLELRLTRESSRGEGSGRVTSDLGWLAAVEADITAKADLNSYVEEVNNDEYTRLLLACWSSKLDAVQRLLTYADQRVDVNKGSRERGWSPLFVAAHNGDLPLARMLLEYGAAVEQRTNDGQSPLLIASAKKHRGMCVLLVEHGANAHDEDRWMGLRPQELLGGMPMTRRQLQSPVESETDRMTAASSSSLFETGDSSNLDGRSGIEGSSLLQSVDSRSGGENSRQDRDAFDSRVDSTLESGARSTGTASMFSRSSSMASRPTDMSDTGPLTDDEGSEGGLEPGRSSL
jgi:hypothetical protein